MHLPSAVLTAATMATRVRSIDRDDEVLRVLQSFTPSLTRAGDSGNSARQPFGRQVVHQVIEASAFVTEEVGFGYSYVLEVQLGGVLRVQTHLVQFAATGKTVHSALHDQ